MRPTAADAWAMYSWLIEGRELRAIDHSDDPPDLKYKEKMRLLRDAIRKRGVAAPDEDEIAREQGYKGKDDPRWREDK